MGIAGRELAFLPLALAILASSVTGFSIGENTRENNCINDQTNATVPRCHDWIGPNDAPIFFPHQYNCSKYWECNVVISSDYKACLRECAPCGIFDMCDGFPALFFDENEKPGPTCNYPTFTNCTNKFPECGVCEAWQQCHIEEDGTVVCSPDCLIDNNCIGQPGYKCAQCDNGYCVEPDCCDDTDCPENFTCVNGECEGCKVDEDCPSDQYCANGECKDGCRDGSICGKPCSQCVNHVCKDPNCCDDTHCADDEFCNSEQNCQEGCNEDSDCDGTNCSFCDMSLNECNDPECCVDNDCQGTWTCENGECKPECEKDDDCDDPEYCDTVNGICKPGCRDGPICGKPCSECVNHVCEDPECCVDLDCKNEEFFCNSENTCQEGCNEDPDCDGTICSFCDMSSNKCNDPECCVNDDCKHNGGMECSECINHTCMDPECCEDPDCEEHNDGKPICSDDNVCIPGCKVDTQCPFGNPEDKCNINTYDDCDYCNMEGSTNGIGNCADGCAENGNCPPTMACSSNHTCTTGGTSNKLNSIKFKTAKCQGCDSTYVEQWLTMFVTGSPDKNGPTNCTTKYLDHPDEQDYAVGTAVTFEGQDDKDPLGECYLANLQGDVKELEVTWSGSGTWSAEGGRITFEMSDTSTPLQLCKLNDAELSPSNPTSKAECGPFFPN